MKHIAYFALIAFVAVFFILVLVFVEENLILNDRVIPLPGVPLAEWLENFRFWGMVSIFSSLLAGVVWYSLGLGIFKIDHWRDSNRRAAWFALILLPIAGTIFSFFFIKQAQEGAMLAYIFIVVNALASYYIGTALFSPPSFKYIPIGASAIRRW